MCAKAVSLHTRLFGRMAVAFGKTQRLGNAKECFRSYFETLPKVCIRCDGLLILTSFWTKMHDRLERSGAV